MQMQKVLPPCKSYLGTEAVAKKVKLFLGKQANHRQLKLISKYLSNQLHDLNVQGLARCLGSMEFRPQPMALYTEFYRSSRPCPTHIIINTSNCMIRNGVRALYSVAVPLIISDACARINHVLTVPFFLLLGVLGDISAYLAVPSYVKREKSKAAMCIQCVNIQM